jgi:hypothetical protein
MRTRAWPYLARISCVAPLLVALGCAAAPSAVVTPPPASAGATPGATSEIGELHRARCGACHVRVEPGARSREALTVALARHRARVHLGEAQWSALIDYLAAPSGPPTGG